MVTTERVWSANDADDISQPTDLPWAASAAPAPTRETLLRQSNVGQMASKPESTSIGALASREVPGRRWTDKLLDPTRVSKIGWMSPRQRGGLQDTSIGSLASCDTSIGSLALRDAGREGEAAIASSTSSDSSSDSDSDSDSGEENGLAVTSLLNLLRQHQVEE